MGNMTMYKRWIYLEKKYPRLPDEIKEHYSCRLFAAEFFERVIVRRQKHYTDR